jgi:hypothetical protein
VDDLSHDKNDGFPVCLQKNNNLRTSTVVTSSVIINEETPEERRSGFSLSVMLTPPYDGTASSMCIICLIVPKS